MANLNKLLPIVLIALILLSAVQAFQLNALKEKIGSGKITATKGPVAAASAGSGSAVAAAGSSGAASIQDLPGMVGGC